MRFVIASVFVFCSLQAGFANAGDQVGSFEHPNSKRDNFALTFTKQFNSVVVHYSERKSNGGRLRRKTSILIPEEIVKATFFDAQVISLFQDAMPAIEVSGECGNKVCEKLIFRYREEKKGYQQFFRGYYSGVSLFQGYLIEAGGSGCCAYEYHAYKIPSDGGGISAPPDMIISVTNYSIGTSSESVACGFSDARGGRVVPPNGEWLDFCTVYGSVYILK